MRRSAHNLACHHASLPLPLSLTHTNTLMLICDRPIKVSQLITGSGSSTSPSINQYINHTHQHTHAGPLTAISANLLCHGMQIQKTTYLDNSAHVSMSVFTNPKPNQRRCLHLSLLNAFFHFTFYISISVIEYNNNIQYLLAVVMARALYIH